jgi:hypothetical protein
VRHKGFWASVGRGVLPQNVRIGDDIVIEEKNQIAPRRSDPHIPGGAWPALWLLKDAQGTRGFNTLQHIDGAVGRSVDDDDDLVFIGWEILAKNGRQGSGYQDVSAVVRRHHDGELQGSGHVDSRKRKPNLQAVLGFHACVTNVYPDFLPKMRSRWWCVRKMRLP